MSRLTPVSHANRCRSDNLTDCISLGLPSAAIFTFRKEDHTLGNMLRQRLLKTAHVIFAAYRVSNLLYAHVASWKYTNKDLLGSSPADPRVPTTCSD